jgi:predicted MPP superfamily phosphohydrolase
MTAHPLFWLYFFLLFNLLIYLTNRVSFHPRLPAHETLWILCWSGIFAVVFGALSLFLMLAWDFSPDSWTYLPLFWKVYGLGMGLYSLSVLVFHLVWRLIIRKPADFRLVSRRYPNQPDRWSAPYSWLKKIGMGNQIHDLEVNEYEVKIQGWPKEFSGLSLAQVSDIHFGGVVHHDYMKFVFGEMRRLKPDFFTLTGDFISRARDIPALESVLKGFKAPMGVYAVLGNHDHWTEGSTVKKILERAKIRVLVNEVVTFKRKGKTLSLMGVDDLWTGIKNDDFIQGAGGDARIILAHNPDHFYLSARAGAHIQISGHCHGGQVCFPIIGPVIVPSNQGRNYAGGFFREGPTTVFINRGIGGFPQVRTLCHPEIVKLTLVTA